jgi:hypothetical protein
MPLLIRIYLSTQSWFEKALAVVRACFVGLWLGVLTRERLHAIDEEYYTRSKRKRGKEYNYHSEEYNRGGLSSWEKAVLARYFEGSRRLLVIGAGGGREVLALQQLGYHVEGFECHPDLVIAANELLQAEGYDSAVHLVPRDKCPNIGATYDGIIIGWGAYMLIQGKKRRIAFLQQLRSQTQTGCPILLSFFYRVGTPRSFKISVLVANVIRGGLRAEPAEVGDWLAPNYVHYFTQDEVTSELSEGGFSTLHYSTAGYGHAIGTAG